MNMCLSLNDYQVRAVWMFRPNSVGFLFVGSDEGWSLSKEDGHSRRIAV